MKFRGNIVELIINGPVDGPVYLFAHGAGADMNSEFMNQVAEKIADKGIRVVRFNFPYMIKRSADGKRRPPDRAPKLIEAYENVIQQLNCPVVIGGKSMGGRMSSMLMTENAQREKKDQLSILGSACLGYPFHAPKKDSKDRLDHLKQLTEPLLIMQGTRDALGNQEEVKGYIKEGKMNSSINVSWLEDGDHDLKPRKASGFNHQQHIDSAVEQVADFIFKLSRKAKLT
jgi:predicted alpha/beta-hydrolase family hydrolase